MLPPSGPWRPWEKAGLCRPWPRRRWRHKGRDLLDFGGLLLCGRGLEEVLGEEDLASSQTTIPAHLSVKHLRFLGACAKGTQRRLATSQKVRPLGACAGRFATGFSSDWCLCSSCVPRCGVLAFPGPDAVQDLLCVTTVQGLELLQHLKDLRPGRSCSSAEGGRRAEHAASLASAGLNSGWAPCILGGESARQAFKAMA